jgi:hypothetical protein
MTLAGLVRAAQRIGQWNRCVEDLVERQPVLLDDLVEALAVDELHGQEMGAVVLLHRVDGDDVGMIERRDALGLALEP